ncbi:MAG: hypothetical protein GKR93_19770 [Gammaproteobacteria bacterium]|nr:hypothetical protein [Gammaproteobacteria bacterium]
MNNSYYPLTGGYTWHYSIRENSVTELKHKKEIVQNIGIEEGDYIQKYFKGAKLYLQEDEEGIRIARVILDNGKELKNDEYSSTILNKPFVIENTWNDIIISHLYNNAEPGSQDVIEAIPVLTSIVAIDDVVKVPAGKYTRCLRIESTGEKFIREGKYAYQPKMTVNVKNTRWYAPGIGLVKEIQSDEANIRMYPNVGFTKELVRFEK